MNTRNSHLFNEKEDLIDTRKNTCTLYKWHYDNNVKFKWYEAIGCVLFILVECNQIKMSCELIWHRNCYTFTHSQLISVGHAHKTKPDIMLTLLYYCFKAFFIIFLFLLFLFILNFSRWFFQFSKIGFYFVPTLFTLLNCIESFHFLKCSNDTLPRYAFTLIIV